MVFGINSNIIYELVYLIHTSTFWTTFIIATAGNHAITTTLLRYSYFVIIFNPLKLNYFRIFPDFLFFNQEIN